MPYEIEEEAEAVAIAGNLDGMLKKKGYVHRVEPATPMPVKTERVVRGRKSVR